MLVDKLLLVELFMFFILFTLCMTTLNLNTKEPVSSYESFILHLFIINIAAIFGTFLVRIMVIFLK
jgi:hypothetical protein